MIFLTIGTHEPFDRLVRAVDDWAARRGTGAQIFGQITEPRAEALRPQHFPWVARLTPEDYERRFLSANLIVSHAGMGSILTALQYNKPIVVMPRRGHLHETRNDHQFTTVRELGARPGIRVAEDEAALPAALDAALAEMTAPSGGPIAPVAAPGFTDALRSFLTAGGMRG